MISRAAARPSRSRRARSSSIGSTLVEAERDEARFEAECGKGAYVRALARDLGRAARLPRPCRLAAPHPGRAVFGRRAARRSTRCATSPKRAAAALQPIEAGLAELPRLAIDRNGAAILRRGQKLLLRGADAPAEGPAYAACFGAPIAFGVVEDGYFVSTRVFNLRGK